MQEAYANPEKARKRSYEDSPLQKLLAVFGEGQTDPKIIREAMESLLAEEATKERLEKYSTFLINKIYF